jgi:hypothetical protein
MDFDDQRDYMDQDFPATAQSGPIAQFLNGMQDWMNMTPEDINGAKRHFSTFPTFSDF